MKMVFRTRGNYLPAIIFTAFYILTQILNLDINFYGFQSLRYIINTIIVNFVPLIIPCFVLIFLLTPKKEYKLRKWLLPIAFFINLLWRLIVLNSSYINLKIVNAEWGYWAIFVFDCLTVIASALMIIGSLFDFKYIFLLKYSAIAYAVINLCIFVIDFMISGGFTYLINVPLYVAVAFIISIANSIAGILYYVGIFIFAKK